MIRPKGLGNDAKGIPRYPSRPRGRKACHHARQGIAPYRRGHWLGPGFNSIIFATRPGAAGAGARQLRFILEEEVECAT
jgi:hypothetical protein